MSEMNYFYGAYRTAHSLSHTAIFSELSTFIMRLFEIILQTFTLICIISPPTFALTLHCKFNDYIYDGNYKCEVENLRIIERNEIVSEISGTHISARRSNADVIILEIEDQTVYYLPKDLGQFFPNLYYLNVYRSKLREITKNDLKDFPKLKTIAVGYNDIESLPGDLFENNQELVHVGFPSNKIKTIGQNIFKSLSHLEGANFLRNECISQQASNRDFIDDLVNTIKNECK